MKDFLYYLFCTVKGLRSLVICLVIWIATLSIVHYQQLASARDIVARCRDMTAAYIDTHAHCTTRLSEELKLQRDWYEAMLCAWAGVDTNHVAVTMIRNHIKDQIPLAMSEVRRAVRLVKEEK